MKNIILSSLTVLSLNFIQAQTNLNFESWSGNNPTGWTSSNDLTTQDGGAQTTFKETASPGEGTSSLKMVTGACPKCPTYISDLTFGFIDCTLPNPYGGGISYGSALEPGIPYSKRPLSIDFKYKSKPAGDDAAGFSVELTRYNPASGESDKIGEASFMASSEVSEWTQVNVPMVYYSTLTPDTINIFASSSIGTVMDCSNSIFIPGMPDPYTDWGLPYPKAGSEFYLDDIHINLPSCSGLSVAMTGTAETVALAGDGTATATASGGTPPYSYDWSNLGTTQTITNLTPGVYSVTVTDGNQCQKTGNYFVAPAGCTLSALITGSHSSTNSIRTGDGSITATITQGNPPYTFYWSNGETATGTSSTISNLPVGTYGVIIEEDNNIECALIKYFTIFGPNHVGLRDDIKNNISLNVYPNPGNGIFYLISEENITNLDVFSLQGTLVHSDSFNGITKMIDLSRLSKGSYLYKVKLKDGTINSGTVIIN